MGMLTSIALIAIGAVLMAFAFPALMKYHANRKPRAAKEAVKAVDNLIEAMNEEDDDDAQRRKDELALQLRKLADRTSELNKAG